MPTYGGGKEIFMNICVYGAASNEIDKRYITRVESFGELFAKRGHNLVFGAGGGGLMGAAARGVKKGNGKIYGFIPEFFKDENIEKLYDQCTELTFTKDMAQRKAGMEDKADAFVIVPGGIGTMEEFFQVLTLKQLGRHTKPIAIFDIDGYYLGLENFIQIASQKRFIREQCKSLYFYSDNMNEIIDYLENDKRIKKDVHDLKFG